MTAADFVARQPHLAWRRRLIKGVLKPIGFGIVWDVTVTGTENIPAAGGTILMMNHISAIDPVRNAPEAGCCAFSILDMGTTKR
ncbi:MAG: hypothetical protein AAFR22_21840 [Chloroflexota bacterium]